MLEPIRAFLAQLGVLLPRLLVAIAVLIAGWLVAKLARFAVAKALRSVNFNVVTERAGLDGFLRNGGVPLDTTGVLALLVYWGAIFAALVIAFNSLGLVAITELMGRVLLFVPRLMLALLILAFGAYFARFVDNALCAYFRGIGLQDADLLGRIARYAILTFAVLIALDQVDVGGDIVRMTFLIVLAGFVFALSLAFGLAGKDWARDLLEHWWPRKR